MLTEWRPNQPIKDEDDTDTNDKTESDNQAPAPPIDPKHLIVIDEDEYDDTNDGDEDQDPNNNPEPTDKSNNDYNSEDYESTDESENSKTSVDIDAMIDSITTDLKDDVNEMEEVMNQNETYTEGIIKEENEYNEDDSDGLDVYLDENNTEDEGAYNQEQDDDNNDDNEDIEEVDEDRTTRTRYSLRNIKQPPGSHHFIAESGQAHSSKSYFAPINPMDFTGVQMSAKKGIKMFGNKAIKALQAKYQQLHDKKVFTPMKVEDLTFEQRKNALRSVNIVAEKRCGRIKGRTCADGRLSGIMFNV